MKLKQKVKDFFYQCKITLRLTKRPTKEEFKNISLVSALGILIMGLIGFAIYLINYYLFKRV
jgi:protein transport protein SEC61 subunit gamma-like protein